MRVAYLDCFAGISGDMLLGAMVDAGVDVAVLERAAQALEIGVSLRVSKVDRSGITATKVDVLASGALAEAAEGGRGEVQWQAKTQHEHKAGHAQTHAQEHEPSQEHGHAHEHGRSLREIRRLIEAAALEKEVKERAVRTFELLGAAESKIHNVPMEEIHFHEVGSVDAIADIVCGVAGMVAMEQRALEETGERLRWVCSALNVGGGMVECAHGTFPVPAPATADLLRGVPTYSAHVQKELVTPTGAALVRGLEPEFGTQPAMRVSVIGYGAGTRNPAGFPNVLRLSIGESGEAGRRGGARDATTVSVLETAVDDCSPQVLAYAVEQLFARGALDVTTAAVGMKKGRAGVLLTVLAQPEDEAAMVEVLLRETTTLGVRRRREERVCLDREMVRVETKFGEVRMKVARGGAVVKAQAEFEDCRALAEKSGVAMKDVMEAAIAAYRALPV